MSSNKFRFKLVKKDPEGNIINDMTIEVDRDEIFLAQLIDGTLTIFLKQKHELYRQIPANNFNPKHPKYDRAKVNEHISFDIDDPETIARWFGDDNTYTQGSTGPR
jgi:hypothetical protein